MSTSPTESVFGVRERPGGTHRDAPNSDTADHVLAAATDEVDTPGTDVEWANSELHSPGTIEELQRRLEVANTRLSSAAVVETTEFEIGRLFVEAQRFSEDALSKLELQIHEILCAAEAKGKEILVEATEEALEIRRQAQEAAFASTTTARELQSAIVGFTTVNNELVKELGVLNSMLAPANEREVTEIDPSSGASERD
jgi:hypothetical protein